MRVKPLRMGPSEHGNESSKPPIPGDLLDEEGNIFYEFFARDPSAGNQSAGLAEVGLTAPGAALLAVSVAILIANEVLGPGWLSAFLGR